MLNAFSTCHALTGTLWHHRLLFQAAHVGSCFHVKHPQIAGDDGPSFMMRFIPGSGPRCAVLPALAVNETVNDEPPVWEDFYRRESNPLLSSPPVRVTHSLGRRVELWPLIDALVQTAQQRSNTFYVILLYLHPIIFIPLRMDYCCCGADN